ncbi:MAG: ABC transporter permease [Bacilli bacterium]|nr:ABC transporter permease [Bacilli bacterium]
MFKKPSLSFPFYTTKRTGLTFWQTWAIRIGAILSAFLLAGILCTIISPGSFGKFFAGMFVGNFSTSSYIFNLLCCICTYLLLSIAVAPAFKMKFWNIGGEGQAMVGAIVTAVMLLLLPRSIPNTVVILLALVTAIAAGIVWALIPTIFKIKFNTNETLFTLMMNYIATALAGFAIAKCSKSGSQTFPLISNDRTIIQIGSVKYLPFIIAAVLLTVVIYIYLTKTKHGFELSVLGDSRNTARYTGININKVILRTMIISGAIAGLVGFLLVCGQKQTLTENLVGGKGFTAVLIAWLGHFNPAEIALYSALVGFFDQGTTYVAGQVKVSTSHFSGLIIGLFILIVVSSEFFVRYQIHVRHKEDKVNKDKKIAKAKKEAK